MSVPEETGLSSMLPDIPALTQDDLARAVEYVEGLYKGTLALVEGTGSVYTNGTGADLDVLVLSLDPTPLLNNGFIPCCADGYGGDFRAYRNGDVNVILVSDMEFFVKWEIAAKVCRYLGTCNKEQRALIHTMCKYNLTHEEAWKQLND